MSRAERHVHSRDRPLRYDCQQCKRLQLPSTNVPDPNYTKMRTYFRFRCVISINFETKKIWSINIQELAHVRNLLVWMNDALRIAKPNCVWFYIAQGRYSGNRRRSRCISVRPQWNHLCRLVSLICQPTVTISTDDFNAAFNQHPQLKRWIVVDRRHFRRLLRAHSKQIIAMRQQNNVQQVCKFWCARNRYNLTGRRTILWEIVKCIIGRVLQAVPKYSTYLWLLIPTQHHHIKTIRWEH